MNWTAVQAIADLVAAFGVIISLMYLAKQVRDSTTALEAATVIQGTELGLDFRASLWGEGDRMAIFVSAMAGEQPTDPLIAARQRMFWLDMVRRHEAMFMQHRLGHLPKGVWTYWAEELRYTWCSTGGRAAIVGLSSFLNPEFSSYLIALQQQTPRDQEATFSTKWSEATATERTIADLAGKTS